MKKILAFAAIAAALRTTLTGSAAEFSKGRDTWFLGGFAVSFRAE